MQDLGDSTLAALMKSDDFLSTQTQTQPRGLKETSPNLPRDSEIPKATKCTTHAVNCKENSLEAFLNDSLVLSRSRYTPQSQRIHLSPPKSAKRRKPSRKSSPGGRPSSGPSAPKIQKTSRKAILVLSPTPSTSALNFKTTSLSPQYSNVGPAEDNPQSFQGDDKIASATSSEIHSPSIISSQDRLKLTSWGLPLSILRKYHSRGLHSMFAWQVSCLSAPGVLTDARNLVYSAPTSAGKTLVSEILLIKTVIERRKKVIFILPFVSVVREKMYYFQDLLSDSGLRVEGFMGGVQPPGGFASADVAIATIEKANSLINQMMEEGGLENLGAVVIDELHLLGDPGRGYLLELLLTKLKYMTIKHDYIKIQLIGMSATLPNLDLLAGWLDAELFKTDFRPIPLAELCKVGSTVYDCHLNPLKVLPSRTDLPPDPDHILALCLETLSDGHSVLIFCPTKNWCETLAQQIAKSFCQLGGTNTPVGESLRSQLNGDTIADTLEQLKRSPAGLDSILRSTVSFGVAYHHAGLTMDERDVVEGAFRSGALRILTATSTLSSGVNLPARRVIIRTIMFHGKPIDTLTYKQMTGRAGRMGRDTAGESIILAKPTEKSSVQNLLQSSLQPIESCLQGLGPLIRSLLEAVAAEVAYTLEDILLYTKCTLLSLTKPAEEVEASTNSAVDYLVENELLHLQESETNRRWVATQLGKACLAASVPPKDGLFLFEELQRARKCFVLDTELHVIYLVTPISSSSLIGQIDWYIFLDIWRAISESERRVGQLVGVTEIFLMKATTGNVRQSKALDIHKRFYTALALHDLVREVPLNVVSRKYSCCRGVIQSLQQTAATFAGMVTQFCRKLGWNCVEILVSQFQARLQFGVCRELLDLLRLPTLNGLRARSLYKIGITSVAELAVADVLEVERALYKALPFESERDRRDKGDDDVERRRQMRTIFVTGRDGLTPREAAVMIVKEARVLVENELGVEGVHWEKKIRGTATQTICEISRSGSESISASNVAVRVSGIESLSSASGSVCGSSIALSNAQERVSTPNSEVEKGKDEQKNQKNVSVVIESDEEVGAGKTAASGCPVAPPSNEASGTPVRCLSGRTSLAKSSSRSPSLFEDSLCLNTQELNLLDQNVIDLDNSVFADDDELANPEHAVFVRPEPPASRPASVAEENGSKSLVWDEDTWNYTGGGLEGAKKLQTPPQRLKVIPKERSSVDLLKKTAKRRLSSPSVTKSPITKVISYNSPGGLSTGSNKSEDDVIVASQASSKTGSVVRTRTRRKLESIRIKTQRSIYPEEKTPAKPSATYVCTDCSAEDIITVSDGEAPKEVPAEKLPAKPAKLPDNPRNPRTTRKPDFQAVDIINISQKSNFVKFKQKLANKTEISVALACEMYLKNTITIGTKIVGPALQEPGKRSRRVDTCVYNDKRLCGVALSWGRSVYFLSFENSPESTLVPIKDRMAFLTDLFASNIIIRCFSTKEAYKTLFRCCSITPSCSFQDPQVAVWLLNPDLPEKSFTNLVQEYLPESQVLLQRLGAFSGPAPGLNLKSSVPSEFRACTEALITFWLLHAISKKLDKTSPKLLKVFQELEMPTVVLLARMELTGIGINLPALQELSSVIQEQLSSLEHQAYTLAGKKFNFCSSKSVAGVLGMDTTKKVSTNKAVLEASKHPIARVVVNWRKLSCTQTKMVFPLLTLAEKSSRIHGSCVTYTATGRINMHEPNLQNVPRDFDSADNTFVISVRMAFVPGAGNVIVSADYCQLELRILAHFSGEKHLLEALRKPGDVFKNIAARWFQEDEERIDDEMRQRTKQLCYGMIYGMGVRSLAETLQVEEAEAREFMEGFMRSYPGVMTWWTEVVEGGRRDGFVETLMGRRRMLPALRSDSPGERKQAERQAVNTKVQGSAADLAKMAMIDIDGEMRELGALPILPEAPARRRLRSSKDADPRGGYLILQLHDELIYEVNQSDVERIVGIIKRGMEGVEKQAGLRVPLPVRVKVGSAWGNLEEYQGG